MEGEKERLKRRYRPRGAGAAKKHTRFRAAKPRLVSNKRLPTIYYEWRGSLKINENFHFSRLDFVQPEHRSIHDECLPCTLKVSFKKFVMTWRIKLSELCR